MGAWFLHVATLDCPLQYFMCFSSMASVLGNQGSANYCAANAFVDGLAHYRRSQGLPALTVNWGVIADVGMAAEEDFYRQNLERNGLTTIHSIHCLEMLELLLAQQRTQTTVCPIDFDTWLRFNPAGSEGRLAALKHDQAGGGSAQQQTEALLKLKAALDKVTPAEHIEVARTTVKNILVDVLRLDSDFIEGDNSLTALGADSLMAIEIKIRLEQVGLLLSITQLLNRNSVNSLAAQLLSALGYRETEIEKPEPVRVSSQASTPGSAWLWLKHQNPDAQIRLFCFPYAGGGSSIYNPWAKQLPASIELIPIHLPGRGAREAEPYSESLFEAAEHISQALIPLLDKPFVLFGHCMGAIMMYEVAQRLEQHG
ncbi:MAG: KR domain-containing protein, partial [Gammaproteobacteria bacterium]